MGPLPQHDADREAAERLHGLFQAFRGAFFGLRVCLENTLQTGFTRGLTYDDAQLLLHLSLHPGCTLQVLADAQKRTEPSVSRKVAQLVKTGWIVRTPDERDGRFVRLYNSEKAERAVTEMAGKAARVFRELQTQASDLEIREVWRILQAIENLARNVKLRPREGGLFD